MFVEKTIVENLSLDEIRHADDSTLQELYNKFRKEFSMWAIKHYKVDEEAAGDIYQQTFIAFYYNVKDGKISELSSSIKTYLFSIGKNILRDHFKKSARFVDPQEYTLESMDVDNTIMDNYERTEMTETISRLLHQIGEPCKTVLELYYFQNYSMESIAHELNYKTEQIAAKRKFICLQQIRSLMEANSN